MRTTLTQLIIHNELANKHYSLEFTQRKDMEIWISNEEGEGMGITVNTLFEIIDSYFKEKH